MYTSLNAWYKVACIAENIKVMILIFFTFKKTNLLNIPLPFDFNTTTILRVHRPLETVDLETVVFRNRSKIFRLFSGKKDNFL